MVMIYLGNETFVCGYLFCDETNRNLIMSNFDFLGVERDGIGGLKAFDTNCNPSGSGKLLGWVTAIQNRSDLKVIVNRLNR